MVSEFLFLGKNVQVYSSAKIINSENLFIDDYSVISDFCFLLASKFIRIGKFSNIAPYSIITGGGEVYIGNFVDISYGVKLISGTDDIYNGYLFTPTVPINYRNLNRAKIEIEDLVFIGANSVIYPGTRIGEGTIINPGTIVKGNLKSWSIYEGQDCKMIGKRKNKKSLLARSQELLNNVYRNKNEKKL